MFLLGRPHLAGPQLQPRVADRRHLRRQGHRLLLTASCFFLIYRVIPDRAGGHARGRARGPVGGDGLGAAKYLFVINLARTNLPAVYGPLAFAVSLVLWAYVSSLVLVFGALMSPRAEPSRR